MNHRPIMQSSKISRILFISNLVACSLLINKELTAQVNNSAKGNTYAVIIGISNYENTGIPRLDYAHRDAEEFAKFLRSGSGGSVPEDHIRLLLNEQASWSAIYNALYWIRDTCKKGDVAYFYFSGHGDVEINSPHSLGFLLAANTPRTNYINSALRIEDLNDFANAISVLKGAKVILITDACRSGKLAGRENRGNFLVGQQLRAARENEIRITSCGPDQLSNEDEGWAGGRGVFSYYLVKGLEGLADYSKDQVVSLSEIKTYLQTALANDKLLAQKEHKQDPVFNGPENSSLFTVDPSRKIKLMSAPDPDAGVEADMVSMAPLGISPQGYLFGLIGKSNLEDLIDFIELEKQSKEEIPFSFIRMLAKPRSKMDSIDGAQINRLVQSLKGNPDALKRFNDKLVELMADRGQQVINMYLSGDEAELERRRYYNSVNNGYELYPKMFAVAMKFVSPQSQLYHMLRVKYHYFKGITARLKIPMSDNPARLIDTAMREQLAALKLQEDAAYIHNELGILYRLKKDPVTAEKYFLRATQISPTWALPWSNLSGLYSAGNDYVKGMAAVEKARTLQPDLQSAFINTGIINEKKGNLLMAEEYFRKSIRLNTRHYLPFERMGYVCMNTTRYAEADSNFLEADRRKRGFKFLQPDSDAVGMVDQFEVLSPNPPCNFDTNTVKKNDVIGNFYMALLYEEAGQHDKAEAKFKQVIQIDPTNPLAFHWLGKILYAQQRWKEADIILSYAVDYHLDTVLFNRYCDSLRKATPRYMTRDWADEKGLAHNCVFDRFKMSWFRKTDTRYFLGTAYEKWNHFEEAEFQFRWIIHEDSLDYGGYYKLRNLFENTGRYQDAEAVVRSYPNSTYIFRELFALYKRIIKQQPGRGEWYYKAGSMMYERASLGTEFYPNDKKYIKQDTDAEFYERDLVYEEQRSVPAYIPGTYESYEVQQDILFPVTEGINYFKQAIKYTPENSIVQLDDKTLVETSNSELLAEMNFKTGDLLVWQGLSQRADVFYKRSVELLPNDANTRIKYVNTSIINYNYGTALEQLDTLNNRGEINFQNQLIMAEYCIHAGRFNDGAKLLTEAKAIHPYKIDRITDLNGRMQLLSGKPLQAIPYYKEYLADHPEDKETMYTIARLYARAKNSTEAWKWLTMALNKGFNYYWVLKNDESWETYRASSRWKTLTKDIHSRD